MKEYIFVLHIHEMVALAILAIAVILVSYLLGTKHGT